VLFYLLTLIAVKMGNFQKLRAWQLAKDLAVKIYNLTKSTKLSSDFGLKDQIQRSAVSIPSNIAEGDESGTNKISVRYFYTAKGSIAELQTQLIIANEIGYIEDSVKDSLIDECDTISIMLRKLIKARIT
jgi:four helix bundle protein